MSVASRRRRDIGSRFCPLLPLRGVTAVAKASDAPVAADHSGSVAAKRQGVERLAMMKCVRGLAMVLAMAPGVQAQLKLPAILSDHMVLQQGAPVPVWGLAPASAEVTVAFVGQTERTTADAAGHWMLTLKPLKAGSAAADMTIRAAATSVTAASSVTIHDVLVGEVWVAGGQSNMAFGLDAMQGKEDFLANAKDQELRLFNVKHETAAEPLGLRPGLVPGDVTGKWEISDAKSAGGFSAVAYLFGVDLRHRLNRPVGLISSNWGGTPIQTWMSVDAFASVPALSKYVEEYKKADAAHRQMSADPQNDARFQADWKQWRKEVGDPLDAQLKLWNEAQAAGKDAGPKPAASRPEPKNPDPTGIPMGGQRPSSPGISWNAMYAPLLPYAVKGALWYQGEANVSHYKEYGLLLRTMVEDWRRQWNEPAMDFLVVQLPANGKNDAKSELAHMREAQATVLTLPHTGLDITYDVGDPGNVHPASKVDVAHRLALIALGMTYREKVNYTGPVMHSATADGSTMRVRFSDAGGKLTIAQQPWVAADTTPFPLDKLIGFQIAGQDGVFHDADAKIEGDSVVLSADGVASPRFVRYAWDNSPRANLYDSSGLPAAPFRTDADRQ